MARCGRPSRYHDHFVAAMLGREGNDDLTNQEIDQAAQDEGNPPGCAQPNDYSRRLDGEAWHVNVVKCGQARLAPNLRPYCATCCYDGPHHIFWSRTTPEHPRANHYRFVATLHW
jgi:hypothetical protein